MLVGDITIEHEISSKFMFWKFVSSFVEVSNVVEFVKYLRPHSTVVRLLFSFGLGWRRKGAKFMLVP